MKLINADALVHIPIYDDQTEETILEEMSIADFLDTFADEGCPPAQPEEDWIPVSKDMPVEYDSVFTRFYGTDK